ncbi:MAG: NYN domain-containing protein [Bacillota bacterium]|nr:NYN domain-containing protein [Bacillota bacterium]
MKSIFVDGYNVINSWAVLSKIKEYSLDAAREKLIELLQNYGAYKGYRIFIVFDAHMVQGSLEKREKMGSVIVVFTKEGETADSFIEKYVNNIGRKFEVCVVTSDSLEQQITFQRGATRMSSIEFYHEVMETEEAIKRCAERKEDNKRYNLEERLDPKIVEKLEKMRRSK